MCHGKITRSSCLMQHSLPQGNIQPTYMITIARMDWITQFDGSETTEQEVGKQSSGNFRKDSTGGLEPFLNYCCRECSDP